MKKVVLLATFVFLGLFLTGCFISPHSFTQGRPIADNKVEKIQKGKTTKEEIINWFGVPTTIIKKGDKTKTGGTAATPPSPNIALPYFAQGVQGTPTGEISSEQLFSLFSSKNKIKDDDVIYYYGYTTTKGSSVGLLFFSTSDSHAVTDKLLILMNEEKGVVEDFIMSKES